MYLSTNMITPKQPLWQDSSYTSFAECHLVYRVHQQQYIVYIVVYIGPPIHCILRRPRLGQSESLSDLRQRGELDHFLDCKVITDNSSQTTVLHYSCSLNWPHPKEKTQPSDLDTRGSGCIWETERTAMFEASNKKPRFSTPVHPSVLTHQTVVWEQCLVRWMSKIKTIPLPTSTRNYYREKHATAQLRKSVLPSSLESRHSTPIWEKEIHHTDRPLSSGMARLAKRLTLGLLVD